ncbi:hypothetical protein FHS14_003649 [Paenibacillus baekrokdamisoli]|nr:hypothetical protein [Paenibacillus baekrokdamisoli]
MSSKKKNRSTLFIVIVVISRHPGMGLFLVVENISNPYVS